jgi:hypothetical protein
MTTTNTEKHSKGETQARTKSRSVTSSKRSVKAKSGSGKAGVKPATHKASRVDAPLQAKVQDYLDRFCDAMTSGDTKTVAALWAIPAFVVDKKDARVISDSAEVEKFFSGAPEMYAQRGIEDTRAEILALDVIDETLVIVTVRWPYINDEGEEVGEETSTYTLKADDSGEFKMCVCTMRGEHTDETQTEVELSH